MRYQQYNLKQEAANTLNYIDGMTDRKYNYLPYWLTMPHKKPAEAEHCRVDDAELVGSWFEAVDSISKILGENKVTKELKKGFRNRLLMSWGEKDLRYSEPYPWTHSIYASFHEMGYILPALNRIVKDNPNDKEIEEKASKLVRGLRSLVYERKTKTFWSGDQAEPFPIYEFPNDVYEQGGFNFTKHTGRGEQCIRNSVMIHALVDRYVIAKDQVALDLAIGLADYLLATSRYFNYKYEFFGHVHSTTWIAAGLIYLYRVTGVPQYFNAGLKIYEYVKSLGSKGGWIPEFAQWKDQKEEHCETCCLKDAILVCNELIEAGFYNYYDDMNRIARNQLSENQIKYTGYIEVENKPDEDGHTFMNLDKRLYGGYTGGSRPNTISLTKFRSIAGCCVGTGPIALGIIWENVVKVQNIDNMEVNVINIVTNKETKEYKLTSKEPDKGLINLKAKVAKTFGFRIYSHMKDYKLLLNGIEVQGINKDGVIYYSLKENDVLSLSYKIKTVKLKEHFAGEDFITLWRGSDMIDILPHGEHVRLYQRDNKQDKYYPLPSDVKWTGVADKGPSQIKPR